MGPMTSRIQTRASARSDATRRRASKHRRWRAVWISVLVLVVVVAALAVVVAIAGSRALSVRDELAPAVPIAKALPAKVAGGDSDGAATDTAELARRSAKAVEYTRDFTWQIAEQIPVLGANFSSVRVAAETVDEVADFAVRSLPSLDLAAFKPKDGAVDLGAVHRLEEIAAEGAALFQSVNARIDRIDKNAVVPQVGTALRQLDQAVSGADETLGALAPVLEVLPSALGEGEPRTYLLMFQGNSELRASGGNPAALALVTADEGRIELTAQATSVQFDNAREESIIALDPETEHIYSDIIGRWIPNMTATPDFPTTVRIMRAWWEDEGLPPFDDVISIDPIALSYMLKATGPIPLATGETLTSENAASLLLNEVYFKYGEGTDASAQDLFFAGAAAQIFSTLTSGVDNPVALMNSLAQATDEGRVKLWSSDERVRDLIAETKLSGTLPNTNTEQTIVGVYFNDTTGAKTDYYADAAISATTDLCTATGAPTFTQKITFADNITPDQAASLPWFITGPHYPAGTIATDVVVYSPVGASIESWAIEGAQGHHLVREGTHLGRDVIRINVVTTAQTKAIVSVNMKGEDGVPASEYGDFGVWTTPMVRETPVTIDAPGC